MTVTSPMGFRASGVTAGLKVSGKMDLALVVNDGPSTAAAAVFTTNRVIAAPVQWSRDAVSNGHVAAVVLNSGGANACTGAQGFQNTAATAKLVATGLEIEEKDVVVCSTGLIGQQLPMDKIATGVDTAIRHLSSDGGPAAAAAIMTTDTVTKQSAFTGHDASGNEFTIGGIAKGSGMLAPGLATMLVVLTTDADIQHDMLSFALQEATRLTFNRLDSDGCMSTNDTVVLLASGASGAKPQIDAFSIGLNHVCMDLANQLHSDAEGATHAIAIRTFNAASESDAETVGRAVARSNLFKTSVFGNDPNWGRVLAAVGTTNAAFEPEHLSVSMNGIQVCQDGTSNADRNLVNLAARETRVEIDLKAGKEEATIRTNDLTHAYVQENSAYTS